MNKEEQEQDADYRMTVTVIGGILIFVCIFAAGATGNNATPAMAFNLAYTILGVFAIGTFMRFLKRKRYD